MPELLRALRHRNYRLFIGGQLISLTGTWMQSVAQAWLVYRLSGSATLLGLVSFSSQIPVLLLAPVGGAVADRVSRHRIVIATQTASMLLAFVLAGLALTGRVQVWHIFLIAASLGTVNAFDIPARQSFLFEMVGRDDLMNAIAVNSSMFNGARVVGPAVAGLLVAAIGEGWCFFLNGLSYVAVIGGLLRMDLAPRPRVAHASAAREAIDGFRFVGRTAPVRALLLLLGLVSFTSMPYSVLMPVFAGSILHGGARGLGILMAAAGLGALGGALTLASRQAVHGLGRWVAAGAAMFGVALLLFAYSTRFWLSAALLVPVGYAMMVEMAASNTLIQSMVPDTLRGRVMAVYSMMLMGMAPFGALAAGWIAERLGAPSTVALGGVSVMVGAAVFALRLRALRPEARALVAAQGLGAGPDDRPAP